MPASAGERHAAIDDQRLPMRAIVEAAQGVRRIRVVPGDLTAHRPPAGSRISGPMLDEPIASSRILTGQPDLARSARASANHPSDIARPVDVGFDGEADVAAPLSRRQHQRVEGVAVVEQLQGVAVLETRLPVAPAMVWTNSEEVDRQNIVIQSISRRDGGWGRSDSSPTPSHRHPAPQPHRASPMRPDRHDGPWPP